MSNDTGRMVPIEEWERLATRVNEYRAAVHNIVEWLQMEEYGDALGVARAVLDGKPWAHPESEER